MYIKGNFIYTLSFVFNMRIICLLLIVEDPLYKKLQENRKSLIMSLCKFYTEHETVFNEDFKNLFCTALREFNSGQKEIKSYLPLFNSIQNYFPGQEIEVFLPLKQQIVKALKTAKNPQLEKQQWVASKECVSVSMYLSFLMLIFSFGVWFRQQKDTSIGNGILFLDVLIATALGLALAQENANETQKTKGTINKSQLIILYQPLEVEETGFHGYAFSDEEIMQMLETVKETSLTLLRR